MSVTNRELLIISQLHTFQLIKKVILVNIRLTSEAMTHSKHNFSLRVQNERPSSHSVCIYSERRCLNKYPHEQQSEPTSDWITKLPNLS